LTRAEKSRPNEYTKFSGTSGFLCALFLLFLAGAASVRTATPSPPATSATRSGQNFEDRMTKSQLKQFHKEARKLGILSAGSWLPGFLIKFFEECDYATRWHCKSTTMQRLRRIVNN
jgi:hypothetical protein